MNHIQSVAQSQQVFYFAGVSRGSTLLLVSLPLLCAEYFLTAERNGSLDAVG
jgi:hypothetical protein